MTIYIQAFSCFTQERQDSSIKGRLCNFCCKIYIPILTLQQMIKVQFFLILYFPFCSWPMYNLVLDPSTFLTQTSPVLMPVTYELQIYKKITSHNFKKTLADWQQSLILARDKTVQVLCTCICCIFLLFTILSLVENGNYKLSNMLEIIPLGYVHKNIYRYSKKQTRNILIQGPFS